MKNEEDLREFVATNNVDAQVLDTDHDCASSESAAKAFGIEADSILKSICFVMDDGAMVVAMLAGNRRVSVEKLLKGFHSRSVRLAHDREICELTGYEKGAVPPIGYKATFVLDSVLADKDVVYAGGGSRKAVLKIRVKDIIRLDSPAIERIT